MNFCVYVDMRYCSTEKKSYLALLFYSYFEGKKRLSSILITGKFKQDVGLSEVFTGQEFSFPVRKPSDFIVSAILKFFKLLAPLLRIHCSDEQFYSLSPLAQTVQVIHISDQPVKLSPDLVLEDNFGEVELDKKVRILAPSPKGLCMGKETLYVWCCIKSPL